MDPGLSYNREWMCEKGGPEGVLWEIPGGQKLLGVGRVGRHRGSGPSSLPPMLCEGSTVQAWKNRSGWKT